MKRTISISNTSFTGFCYQARAYENKLLNSTNLFPRLEENREINEFSISIPTIQRLRRTTNKH